MKRKIILNLAMSIDGYIADEDGGFAWIVGDGDERLDTQNKWDYEKFLEGIDIVVMGKKCYDQGFLDDFKDKKVYVATTKELEDHDNINFINGDICKVIEEERKKEGKDIFLFGGGVLIDSFLKADIIDEYIIGIIPTILGSGRPLFLENNPKIDLHLDEYIADKGIVILKYSKR
ncbi:MAG: dihydrofolate reductase [Clostridium butyricum]|nr:dihydrofolate reductase [Clostridium butyricum]